jgi:peptidoglycan/xylan/chitin deacetylase (PgdA/CDA1 family)
MVELLDEVGMRASVLLNSDVCARYPEIVRAGVERDWAWVAHGATNSRLWTGLEPDAERRALADIFETIAEATGRAPKGWLGPALTETANTPALLSELGARYLLDWTCDDQPFPLNVDPGPMISVPYSAEVNDIAVFGDKCMSGSQFEQLLLDQFEVLYEESRSRPGAVMGIALHPFVVNLPFRHKYLARALRRIVAHDDVWLTTTDDICDWYFAGEYEHAVAALAGARA